MKHIPHKQERLIENDGVANSKTAPLLKQAQGTGFEAGCGATEVVEEVVFGHLWLRNVFAWISWKTESEARLMCFCFKGMQEGNPRGERVRRNGNEARKRESQDKEVWYQTGYRVTKKHSSDRQMGGL